MARSRSCRRIALILIAIFLASNIFICNGKVQFTCTYTKTKVLNRIDLDYDLVHHRSRQLIAAGYILLSKPNALSINLSGPCYDPVDCDRICSQLANSRADIYTGNTGNCASDGTTNESSVPVVFPNLGKTL
ncbi:hypothetical protein MKW92_011219 [Papaver armeniacum]|nr:hypothetical protein MKW92_011219 [Papaver armeniacum]